MTVVPISRPERITRELINNIAPFHPGVARLIHDSTPIDEIMGNYILLRPHDDHCHKWLTRHWTIDIINNYLHSAHPTIQIKILKPK